MNCVGVRLADNDDISTIADFNIALALETEERVLSYETVCSGIKVLMKKPQHGFYIVAESNGKCVATLMVTTEWSDWRNGFFWWIQSVYVEKKLRRYGIYSKMYQFVKDQANMKPDVWGFRLYVEKDNVHAKQTYRAMGMRKTSYELFEEKK